MEIADPRIPLNRLPKNCKASVVAKNQPQYRALPAVFTPDGKMYTRWTPTEEERRKLLEGEDIFIMIQNGGKVNPMMVYIGQQDWSNV